MEKDAVAGWHDDYSVNLHVMWLAFSYIISYMHCKDWICDIELLMLAESANMSVIKAAIGWKDVVGSKLNAVWDSLAPLIYALLFPVL